MWALFSPEKIVPGQSFPASTQEPGCNGAQISDQEPPSHFISMIFLHESRNSQRSFLQTPTQWILVVLVRECPDSRARSCRSMSWNSGCMGEFQLASPQSPAQWNLGAEAQGSHGSRHFFLRRSKPWSPDVLVQQSRNRVPWQAGPLPMNAKGGSAAPPDNKKARRSDACCGGPEKLPGAERLPLQREVRFSPEDGQRIGDRVVGKCDGADGLRQTDGLVERALMDVAARRVAAGAALSLIHISEPTRH